MSALSAEEYEMLEKETIERRDAEWNAMIDSMIKELQPKPGLEVLGMIHGAESIEALMELKGRMAEPPQTNEVSK